MLTAAVYIMARKSLKEISICLMISLSISFNPHHYSPCTCSLWNPKLKILQLGIATWSRTYKSRESNTEFCNPYGNNKKQIEWYLTLSFLPPVLDRVAPGDKKKKKNTIFQALRQHDLYSVAVLCWSLQHASHWEMGTELLRKWDLMPLGNKDPE